MDDGGVHKDKSPENVRIAPQGSEVCCPLGKSLRECVSVKRNKNKITQR